MTDDKIKKYFLGDLAESKAIEFEETCAQNAELTEQSQMIESELIDDYVRANLSAPDRKLFETNYLTTESRYDKLKFARIFLNNFKTQPATEPNTSFWQSLIGLLQPRFAMAGILAFLILGGLVFVFLNWQTRPEIARQQNSNQPPTPNIENQNTQIIAGNENKTLNLSSTVNNSTNQIKSNRKTPTPTPEITPTPTPKNIESAPTFATFVLSSGTLRSGGEQAITIPQRTSKVNLHLNLPKDAIKYQTYNATIKTADGETVSVFSSLKSLNLNLPANKLKTQTYIIFLEGQNAKNPAESIAEYTFKVLR